MLKAWRLASGYLKTVKNFKTMTKVQFFYRLIYGCAVGAFIALAYYLPGIGAKVVCMASAGLMLYLYVRSVVVYLPQQRNKLKYFALHAESKQIVFKPVASGLYRVALVTFTYKHTPEHAFTLTDAPGQSGLKWDKATIGALREHTGRHVTTFADVTQMQAYRLIKRLVKDDKSGTHIFEAVYLSKAIKRVQTGWRAWASGLVAGVLNPPPTLSGGAEMPVNSLNCTMVFALFSIQLPEAINVLITLVWIASKLLRYIRTTAERDNRLNNADAVCTLVRAMLQAEASGNMAEADKLNERLNRLK